tara:strand:+ start:1243 stop:2175 length:933 start_codon:yes stop_codon:yes gene_type:complete
MKDINPNNQTKLFGLENFLLELAQLYTENKLPNKILLSGQKGLGKSTLAYHFINYILSKDEDYKYDINNFEINPNNHSYKVTNNGSNPNLTIVDIDKEKKFIDINQIRNLIIDVNKSSFNNKPRFVLIDNIEYLNINSINSLLKVLEEPNFNIHFILINNNKKILPTLLSRCINFKIHLTNNQIIQVTNNLLDNKLDKLVNNDLINFYSTPGNIYNLVKFADIYGYDLINFDLRSLLIIIIKENHFKKDNLFKHIFFDLIEFYLTSILKKFSLNNFEKYHYFLKRMSDTRKYNLDEESFFIEFNEEVLNG